MLRYDQHPDQHRGQTRPPAQQQTDRSQTFEPKQQLLPPDGTAEPIPGPTAPFPARQTELLEKPVTRLACEHPAIRIEGLGIRKAEQHIEQDGQSKKDPEHGQRAHVHSEHALGPLSPAPRSLLSRTGHRFT